MKKYDIYLIWGKDCEGNILRYYGSTANFIKRKSEHKKNYKRWVEEGKPSNNARCSSVHILDNGAWRMDKIDEIDGERWQARKLEGEYIKKNDCVNFQIASRTRKERYNDNRGEILKKCKEYRLAHRDEILKKNKEYKLAHRDEILKKSKEYYNLNKEAISEKNKEKIICECGSEIRKDVLYIHHKSKKHINFINSLNNND